MVDLSIEGVYLDVKKNTCNFAIVLGKHRFIDTHYKCAKRNVQICYFGVVARVTRYIGAKEIEHFR